MEAGELPAEWVTGPDIKPAGLCGYLISHGFEKQYDMIGMAADRKIGFKEYCRFHVCKLI